MDYRVTPRRLLRQTYPVLKQRVDDKQTLYNKKIAYFSNKSKQIITQARVIDPLNRANFDTIVLNYRHEIIDCYNTEKKKAIRLYRKYDELYVKRDIYYTTMESYREKSSIKKLLIDSDLAEYNRMLGIVEVFIDYLRDCKKSCDGIDYYFKSDLYKKAHNNQ